MTRNGCRVNEANGLAPLLVIYWPARHAAQNTSARICHLDYYRETSERSTAGPNCPSSSPTRPSCARLLTSFFASAWCYFYAAGVSYASLPFRLRHIHNHHRMTRHVVRTIGTIVPGFVNLIFATSSLTKPC